MKLSLVHLASLGTLKVDLIFLPEVAIFNLKIFPTSCFPELLAKKTPLKSKGNQVNFQSLPAQFHVYSDV